jgi:hypothetical protein
VVPIGGTITGLHLSPDRRWLFFLNVTEGRLGKVDTAVGRLDKTLRLADGTETLCPTPDGKTLAAAAPDPGRPGWSLVQIIDPSRLELRKSFAVPATAYDVAANDAGLVFLSGVGRDWTEIAAIDTARQEVVARWGGVWTRSFLHLSRDQRRLYCSSQGVTPGTLEALVLPRKPDEQPLTCKAAPPAEGGLGGDFVLSPDGRFLLCKTGTVLRLSAARDGDLSFHARVEPFAAAAVDPEAGSALVLTPDGLLEFYAYPDFRLVGTARLGLTPYAMAWEGKGGRLYVAGIDPRAVAERSRARGHGDIHVYDVRQPPAARP